MSDTINFDPVKAEEHLREVVTAETWKDMSPKLVRERLEKKLGLDPDGLKPHKKEINKILDKIVTELSGDGDSDPEDPGAEESDGDDEDSEPALKKQKTKSEPPKNLKKLQATLMSRQSFLEQAPVMSSRIGDLAFDMKPRTFSSGSCGWFHGGKVAIKVGDQEIWCQLGVNCTVLGSKEWRDTGKKGKK